MQRSNWRTLLAACLAAITGAVATQFAPHVLDSSRQSCAADGPVAAASVADTVKVLDLRTFALPEGAVASNDRQLGAVNYETPADPKKAFQVQQQQFLKLGWKELPGSMAEAAYGTGMFLKSSFVVSVTTSDAGNPDKPGSSRVMITNLSNVRPGALPVLKGAKSQFVNEATAIYFTSTKLAEAAETTRKLLVDAGWEPYGAVNTPENEIMTFKRHAVQATVMVGTTPAEGGKTSIMFSTLQLSADIPAPANAEELQYVDMQKTLRFQSQEDFAGVAAFYQQALAKRGWAPTTLSLITMTDEFKRPIATQIFRNAEKEILSLDLQKQEDKTHVTLVHQTSQELAAAEQRAKEAAQRLIAEKEKSSKPASKTKPTTTDDDTPSFDSLANDVIKKALSEKGSKGASGGKDQVSIPIPEKVKKTTQTSDNVLQIRFAAGTGKATAIVIREQLLAKGWKVNDDEDLDKTSGNLEFKKDTQQINLTYVDTGVADGTLMVIGIGAKLAPGKVEPIEKAPEKKPDSK